MKHKYLIFLLSAMILLFNSMANGQDIASGELNKKEKNKKEKVKVEKQKKEKVEKQKKVKLNRKVVRLNKIQEQFNFDSLMAAQTAATVTYESRSEADLKYMKVENLAKSKKAILDARIDKTRKKINSESFEKTKIIQSKASVKIERIQSKADRKKEKAESKGKKGLIQIKAIEEVENLKYMDFLRVKKREFQLEADIKIQEVEEKSAEKIAKSRSKLNKAKLKALKK